MDFNVQVRSDRGVPIAWAASCMTCSRIYFREYRAKNIEKMRARENEWRRQNRRAAGIPPRFPDKEPKPNLKQVRSPRVDAGPLLEEVDQILAYMEEQRAVKGFGGMRKKSDVVTAGELLGNHLRALHRARETGRIELSTADEILTKLRSGQSIWTLWPEAA